MLDDRLGKSVLKKIHTKILVGTCPQKNALIKVCSMFFVYCLLWNRGNIVHVLVFSICFACCVLFFYSIGHGIVVVLRLTEVTEISGMYGYFFFAYIQNSQKVSGVCVLVYGCCTEPTAVFGCAQGATYDTLTGTHTGVHGYAGCIPHTRGIFFSVLREILCRVAPWFSSKWILRVG